MTTGLDTTERRSVHTSCISCKGSLAFLVTLIVAATGCTDAQRSPAGDPDQQQWIQLFNGRDLSGWDVKFRGYDLNQNVNNTFRVEDGLLKVRYDEWDSFDGEFGHIFFEEPFSYYRVAVEYRFVGEQVAGAGPDLSWAIRNNGIMVHSQSAESMGRDQDFPISIEVQLLGGLDAGERSTANLCTPGTHVVMNGELTTDHCINSRSATYHGDQWVRVEALVLGDSLVQHIIDDEVVLEYSEPQMGGGVVSGFDTTMFREGEMLSEGHIALQAETAPIDFRKVEILSLVGCTDPEASNYKSYYVSSDPEACTY